MKNINKKELIDAARIAQQSDEVTIGGQPFREFWDEFLQAQKDRDAANRKLVAPRKSRTI